MKKIIALILIAVLMLSLSCCAGNTEPTAAPTEAPALSTYSKDFVGLQQYLIDQGLVAYADLTGLRKATADEAAPTEAATETATQAAQNGTEAATQAETQAPTESTVRTPVFYDLLGADDGIRYLISGTVFVELYDFSKAKDDKSNKTAQKILADIKDDGKFTVVEGTDELTGVISKSGKYVVAYNEKNSYDKYADVTKVLENW